MILTCNECEWSFKIDSALIKESGSNVRCSKCGDIWMVYPTAPEEEVLVLETVESDDGSLPDEASEPAPLRETELEIEVGQASDTPELPELTLEPGFVIDEDELPDLE